MPNINYKLISDAVEFYKERGYTYVELKWHVSKESMMVTSPKDRRLFTTIDGNLVASGEQCFIENRSWLKKGAKYMCVTPCFRDESRIDEIHQRQFVKLELIHVQSPKTQRGVEHAFLLDMLFDARTFFERYIPTRIVKIDRTYDLESVPSRSPNATKLELGSYGVREYKNFRWIYGTGCAEPRLSWAVSRQL